jgi:pilus assembly protein CpaE
MRTLVASNDLLDPVSSRLREILHARVDSQGLVVAGFADVEKRLPQSQAEMLVVVLSPDPEAGLQTLGKVRRLTSGHILAVGQASDADLILRALQEGADHYLDEADLEKGIDTVLARWQKRAEPPRPPARLVAVLAASGGCGASTLAVNIATVLAKDHGKCALIDLKPGKGDLTALLDLKPAYHLADLCQNSTRLDQAMFEKVLARHPCGVHLLASPHVFGDNRLVNPQGVAQALTLARAVFSHVVVDLEDCFHEEQVLTLRQATSILLVSRLDFTSLRNVRRILDHLSNVGVSQGPVRLAINRHGQANELPAREAEEALGGKLAYYIPDDPKTINGANNAGVPVVLKAPTAKVSQAIIGLARDVLERRGKKDSFLSKLFAR